MRKTAAAFVLALLLASPARAQLGENLGAPFSSGADAFSLSVLPGPTASEPAADAYVRLELTAKPHNKIYRSSVKVTLRPNDVFDLVNVDIPEGIKAPAEPNTPAGEAVLKGENTIVIRLHPKKRLSNNELKDYWPVAFDVQYAGCSDEVCFPPATVPVRAKVRPLDSDVAEPATGAVTASTPPSTDNLTTLAGRLAKTQNFAVQFEAKGFLVALAFAFGAGFLVSLTPCVWPLIPIILAVVGASAEGSGWKRGLGLSLVYILGISIIYAALGAVAGALGRSVQGITQTPWLVAGVCLVFVALALSMFGLYDIRIPSSVAARLQGRRGTGVAGVFIMGLVSGLVASPCVSAPLLGLFAGVATLGSVWIGALAGFVFALGMGIILIVAGTSSKALASLPKSGEWMVSVKQFFGWVMIGAAVWFTDMVFGATVYRWLMIAFCVAALLSVAWSMGAQETASRLSKGMKMALVLGLGVVLIYFSMGFSHGSTAAWVPGIEDGLQKARATGRPVFIDVTAAWCSYCREMDREVFSSRDFIDESRRFVMVRFDATIQSPAVADFYKKYGIAGPPALVFIPTSGKPVTVNGKQDHDTILDLMRATH